MIESVNFFAGQRHDRNPDTRDANFHSRQFLNCLAARIRPMREHPRIDDERGRVGDRQRDP